MSVLQRMQDLSNQKISDPLKRWFPVEQLWLGLDEKVGVMGFSKQQKMPYFQRDTKYLLDGS